jgi:hypothetical protein
LSVYTQGEQWLFPSAGEIAAKRTANERTKTLTKISFQYVCVGLAIALMTLSC